MKKIITAAVILIYISAITSCKSTTTPGNVLKVSSAIVVDTTASSCPYLTKDTKGNVVMSWVRELNDSSSIVCYAMSANGGKTFNAPIEIPASKNVHPHGENMPKILFKPNGEIIAAWGASNPNPDNLYSGLVYYSQSFDNGRTWNGLNRLVKDTNSNDERYFDMALLPNGEAAIVWLDNRTKTDKEGSTLYFAATNGKNGFENEMPIGETCCQCCRTGIFIGSNGNIHVIYRDIISDSIRDMVHTVSTDGGKTFSPPHRISKDNWVINGCPHTGPAMTENKDGLQFSWYTGGKNGGIYYCSSQDNGNTFSQRDSVSILVSAKHPQIKSLSDGSLLIVWDENVNKGATTNSWVECQLRTPEGKKVITQPITPDSCIATFPVIKEMADKKAILAYTQKTSGKEHVYYQILSYIVPQK